MGVNIPRKGVQVQMQTHPAFMDGTLSLVDADAIFDVFASMAVDADTSWINKLAYRNVSTF